LVNIFNCGEALQSAEQFNIRREPLGIITTQFSIEKLAILVVVPVKMVHGIILMFMLPTFAKYPPVNDIEYGDHGDEYYHLQGLRVAQHTVSPI
jgi:hypothetical protein